MAQKRLPIICPSCQGMLEVNRLVCNACETSVEGKYDLPILVQLPVEDQDFILKLIQASGSLKELAGIYGISYPTVRNRLDSLIQKISLIEEKIQKQGN
jgi:hypothetical protein